MRYYLVDAFTQTLFHGNPACVCLTEKPLPEPVMQQIAAELNLSETAFVRPLEEGYELRWFTPKFEIDLCGHATLASAYVLTRLVLPAPAPVRFFTQSGILEVRPEGERLAMDFPNRKPIPTALTTEQSALLGCHPVKVLSSRDLILVLETEEEVRQYRPDYAALGRLSQWLGVVVTAPGKKVDFVSRYFCPELGLEDPVTGSTHSALTPYWAEVLGKTRLTAAQLSPRGGLLETQLKPDGTITILGSAVLFAQGEMNLP